MTIDERTEKLTERHEALTQSVELMVHENRKRFGQIVTALEHLTHIAEIHEHRLDNLEGTS